MSSDGQRLSFSKRLPKIELHAHLSGSISRACLHDIWLQKQPAGLQDPIVEIPLGKVDYDLTTFFPLFSSYIYKLCNDEESIRFSTLAVLKDFEDDGVVYLELRTTPREILESGISKAQYVDIILDCIVEYERDPAHRLRTYLILSIDRRNTIAQAEHVIDLAISHQHKGVVAIDLCGDPSKGPVDAFGPAFARAKAANLKVTLHFAEALASSTDEELYTLLSWQPDRIGHVIHVHDDLRREILRRGIGVELCLSCNVHAKMITGGFGEHHFGWWKDHHVGVALCTDDVGVFCSPLSAEYSLAIQHFGLGVENVQKLCMGVVDIIFGGQEEKARLRELYSSYEGWASITS